MLDAIAAGETFVTNGPLVDLHAEVPGSAAGIGGTVRLTSPGAVRVTGRVRFDPARDSPTDVELVHDGVVAALVSTTPAPGELRVETSVDVTHSGWIALRVRGHKVGEVPFPEPGALDNLRRSLDRRVVGGGSGDEITAYRRAHAGLPHPSAAHTGALWINVGGTPAPSRPELVHRWLSALDDLESELDRWDTSDELIHLLPYSDGVTSGEIAHDRDGLEAAIHDARRNWRPFGAGGPARAAAPAPAPATPTSDAAPGAAAPP
jgi:hypothetical protein